MPAWPTSVTSRGFPSRAVAWNCSLSARSSSSRPTNGGSSMAARPSPRRRATTAIARQAASGDSLPLSCCAPASSKLMAPEAARNVASPTSTVPGTAADWRREAVLTRSPATMPWPAAPMVTAACPVSTPARACMPRPSPMPGTPSTSSSAARTARSASSSCVVGVPHTAITASPMNFSIVPPCRSTISRASSK